MWEQCFVIGASVHQRMCISMWCLLPGKQRRYYEEALNFVRERTSAATPIQFGIGSPAPSTLTWPTTVSPREQLVQYSLSPLQTSTAPSVPAWEDEIVRAPHFQILLWNMHSQATSALARTNNGLEATHLHFMKGLCHHPALLDFICAVNESIDTQVDAARSARHFIHKRHKRYILQNAVIMRILADASYNSNGEISDLMSALGLQVEGYAGKTMIQLSMFRNDFY